MKESVVSLEPVEGQPVRDCWTVAFGNSVGDERCIAAGYDNGDVKLFDLRTNSMRWETNASNGVTCVEFDRKDVEMNKLAVCTLESRFRIFDVRTQHAEEGFAHVAEKAHKATVWLARFLPQNRDVWMTGGGNGGFNLYTYHYPPKRQMQHKDDSPCGVPGTVELLNSRVISTQPIVSFDWSPDKEGLACLACLDQTLRVYICTKLLLTEGAGFLKFLHLSRSRDAGEGRCAAAFSAPGLGMRRLPSMRVGPGFLLVPSAEG